MTPKPMTWASGSKRVYLPIVALYLISTNPLAALPPALF